MPHLNLFGKSGSFGLVLTMLTGSVVADGADVILVGAPKSNRFFELPAQPTVTTRRHLPATPSATVPRRKTPPAGPIQVNPLVADAPPQLRKFIHQEAESPSMVPTPGQPSAGMAIDRIGDSLPKAQAAHPVSPGDAASDRVTRSSEDEDRIRIADSRGVSDRYSESQPADTSVPLLPPPDRTDETSTLADHLQSFAAEGLLDSDIEPPTVPAESMTFPSPYVDPPVGSTPIEVDALIAAQSDGIVGDASAVVDDKLTGESKGPSLLERVSNWSRSALGGRPTAGQSLPASSRSRVGKSESSAEPTDSGRRPARGILAPWFSNLR